MPSQPDALADAAPLSSVVGPVEEPSPASSPLVGYDVGLEDGGRGRAFALQETDQSPVRTAFLGVCREWEDVDDRAGITPVLARSEDSEPWIVVEGAGATAVQCGGQPSQRVEQLVADLAEILHQVDTPHGALTPAHLSFHSSDSSDPHLDWALGRVARLHPDTPISPYTPPELLDDPTGGDGRSDVYGLGALTWFLAAGEPPVDLAGDRAAAIRGGEPQQRVADSDVLDPALERVCRRALSPDPADRYDSPYEFKRAVLFGESGGGGQATEQSGDSAASGASTVPSSDSAAASDGAAADDAEGLKLTGTGAITRRQALGAVGLVAGAAGAVALSQYGGSGGSDEPGAGDDPENSGGEAGNGGGEANTVSFETTYVSGLVLLEYTGDVPIEASSIRITGDGIAAEPSAELTWALFQEGEDVEAGSAISFAADPAYRIVVSHPDGETSSAGPAAEETDPRPGRIPTPDLAFTFEYSDSPMREGGVRVELRSDVPVMANHLLLDGQGSETPGRRRWHELSDLAPAEFVPSDPVRYPAGERVLLSVEWSPPYLDGSELLAQYHGPARPGDATIGTVRYPQFDPGNTGFEPSVDGFSTVPERVWETEIPRRTLPFESLAVQDGRLFVSGEHFLYCLDATDGAELWRTRFDASNVLPPTLWQDRVFVGTVAGSGPGKAVALDTADGSVVWEFEAGHDVMWTPFPAESWVFTGPAGQTDGTIHVLDAAEGEEIQLVAEHSQQFWPAADREFLYLSSRDAVRAISPAGTEWTFDRSPRGPATLVGDSLYVVTEVETEADSREMAISELDTADGSVRWQSDTYQFQHGRSPAVADGTIFFGTADTGIRAVEPGSGEQWMTETGPLGGSPVVAGDQLYASTLDGTLFALDPASGDRRWSLDFDQQLLMPAVTDEWLFVRDGTGTVYGFSH